ncbi:hypothetical protein [Rhodopirellula bahusiensis]|uniref:hypothetical protein n=1 Tax=Rhodopirellula bahusiensis TaxID=2014065 RepID=UPI003265E88F
MNLESARKDWISGKISRLELLKRFRSLRYEEVIDGGLTEWFDDVSQVCCASELVADNSGDVGVREYALSIWEEYIKDENNSSLKDLDYLGVLKPRI